MPGGGLRASREAEQALLRAFASAREEGVTQVTPDHLMQGIARVTGCRGAAMLGMGQRWAPLFAPDLGAVLGKAQRLATESGASQVTLEHLQAVLLAEQSAERLRSTARRAAPPRR